ncbi:type II CRISPR RNA-guided endonuclease Cas9 [Dyadobacter frigoris]|uniref:CRISPR-associated endonuclease Cas9 n=1 Tax=Dyadobacter frigoris TaxID=2576211 RepID=A0A4U6D453_9BACT|nr:type II CRISPR RNA-guided endonuclease Cas9 [Dyadobacter frigoris]TKT90941.1 type II CRISPR RNA-guided endonuclease Cas9 [Dyadobacter frigoris]
MSKKILGLDLGTTSIGWAFVIEADNQEYSEIKKIGVRVNPLTTDEQTNFEKGKPVSVNADRTLKRGARRNLQRYKQRRENLVEVLKNNNLITSDSVLAENDKNTTHSTFEIRARAASEKVEKEELARILLMINKKRGYKSSRKAKNEEEGQAIDGMAIAKRLYDENLTPGQLSCALLKEGRKVLPDFYRSDLQTEFNGIWDFHQSFYPDILTDGFKNEIAGKGQRATAASFWNRYKFNTAENKGTKAEKRLRSYEWRSKAINTKLSAEEVAYVLTEVNNNISNSSGYLGEISDRSKELYFNKETIGQYLYKQLLVSPHSRMKGQVFYRQDYFDEFETIWETQSRYHSELTKDLKIEIRDIIIFYQRKLKSQKGQVGICELENKEIDLEIDGKKVTRTIGAKVIPKSSPLFQEFKIWQNLNNLLFQNKKSKEIIPLDLDAKGILFEELNSKGNLKTDDALNILGYNPKEWDANFSSLEGNKTNQIFYETFLKMLELEGHEEYVLSDFSGKEIKELILSFFESMGIEISILNFSADLDGKAFEKQPAYLFWHLLYSYTDDSSTTGDKQLLEILQSKFGFKKEHAILLSNINFENDYGNLSAKAIRKILPFLKAGHPLSGESKFDGSLSARLLAGYKDSSSITKEENDNRDLKERLKILPKNSLRNPVVEKILNQMVNVVNAIIDDPSLGRPDEIRIELARELKKNAKEREEMTSQINSAKTNHEAIRKKLINEFGVKNPTRNDIIRFKLYDELKLNSYKDLYTNHYISPQELFTNKYDIEHIIPKSRLFDDSFSNKTIVPRSVNANKDKATAYDFISNTYSNDLKDYLARVEMMFKTKDGSISKAKYKKLLMKGSDIGEGFIERDLRDSQYIAKKAKQMLLRICRTVVSTTGSVTDRLREDWNLVNVMQELNMDKFRKLGLTEMVEKKDGSFKERITEWTKRNDHRHHGMDALTIAFTRHEHIQYLNNLNAKNKEDKKGKEIYGIEQKITFLEGENGSKKRKFKAPLPNFRNEAKSHLENLLISCKSKNKVTTKNKNKVKVKNGTKTRIELTPRGALHKETVYGRIRQYKTKEEKIGAKFDLETIKTVANSTYRDLLTDRLLNNENDPKKAFTGANSLIKKPIYINSGKVDVVPEKVKLVWLEDDFTIRKEITPDLKIDKVIDSGIRKILENRLMDFDGNAKEAFSNLDKNPIWLNEKAGIAIKRVKISGVKNAESLHYKKDNLGNYVEDNLGKRIPTDFVSTGSNHHVAIYRDEEGNLQDQVISFYETVERVNQGLSIIDRSYNQDKGWKFLFSMKQNEYFVFPASDFDPSEVDLLNSANNKLISPNLFRVQKFSKVTYGNSSVRDYVFRHHLETSVEEKKALKDVAYKSIKSVSNFENIIKVRVNHIGKIVKVGEY